MVAFRLVWRGGDPLPALRAALAERLQAAAEHVLHTAQQSINESSYGGERPSRPGEPPHRDTGQLQRGLTLRVDRAALRADVAATAPYARRLELGFVGRDSAGRYAHQAPRPFLRRALWGQAPAIVTILSKPM